jgi:actin-related protein
MALPCNCTLSEVERIIDLLFREHPVSSLFLINPWMAVLSKTKRRTALMVYVEETATAVVCVVNFKVEHLSVNHLPLGARDYTDKGPEALKKYVENVQAVCAVIF